VRTVLVPALVFITGDTFWWPVNIGNKRTGAHLAGANAHVAK
jgi:uncharacterized membrane protein YdfJ with MMPL/SSD domain